MIGHVTSNILLLCNATATHDVYFDCLTDFGLGVPLINQYPCNIMQSTASQRALPLLSHSP